MLRSRLQTLDIIIRTIDIRLVLTPIKDYVLRKLVWGANKCTSSKLGRQVAVFPLAENICRSQDWKKSLNHGSQFSSTAETEAFKSFTILVKLQLGFGLAQGDIQFSSPRAESARAFTGRRNSHSGRGEDFLTGQPDFFTETAVTPERKVEKWFPRWEINRHAEG